MGNLERGEGWYRKAPKKDIATNKPTEIISFGADARPRMKTHESAPIIMRGKKPSAEVRARREAEKALFERGEPTQKIAEQFGISQTAVNRDRLRLEAQYKVKFARAKKGGPLRKPLPETIARRQEIKPLLESGMTPRDIAEQLGVSSGIVYNERSKIEKENNVKFVRGIKRKVGRPVFERDKRGPKPSAEAQRQHEDKILLDKLGEIENLESHTPGDLAKQFGVTIPTIYHELALLRQREEKSLNTQKSKKKEPIYEIQKPNKEEAVSKVITPKTAQEPVRGERQRGASESRRKRWEKALELRGQNLTDKEIGEVLGLKESTVTTEWSLMKRAGIEVGKKRRTKPVVNKQVAILKKDKTAAEIAAELGTTTRAIQARRTRLRQKGVDIPKRPSGRVPSEALQQTMREAVRMRDAGVNHAQIARELHIPQDRVGNYIYRGRKLP